MEYRSDTLVSVKAPQLSGQNNSFAPASSTLPADGKSTQILTLSVRDGQNNPVDVAATDIVISQTKGAGLHVSSPGRKSAGVYELLVTAGTANETLTLTPSVPPVKPAPPGSTPPP